MKKILPIFLYFFLLIVARSCYAEEFALTKIGTLMVNNMYYTHWWYSETKPTFKGTGSRGANIDISIDSIFKTVKASTEDGTWEFTPETPLEKKDHTVSIASGNQQISFILTIGSDVPQNVQSKGGVSELPQTGNLLPTFIIITLAGGLIYLGLQEKLL